MPKPNEAEMQLRRSGITGTDISAILGLNPYATPLSVYDSKDPDLRVEDWAENEDTDRGNFLEPGIRVWSQKKIGRTIHEGRTVVNSKNKLIIASPDGIVPDANSIAIEATFDAKAPGERVTGWGEHGTDQVPPHVAAQVCWQMAALGVELAYVGALIHGRLRVYEIPRDPGFEDMLIMRATQFWEEHVVAKKPPLALAPDLEWLKRKFPQHRAELIQANREQEELLAVYVAARRQRLAFEEVEDKYRAQLEQIIGDAAGISWRGGRIDWKSNKPRLVTDWKALVMEVKNYVALNASVNAPWAVAMLKELDAMAARYTQEQPGNRPFVPRLNGVTNDV